MKVTILTADISHNCVSRARLLARLINQHHDVELVGPAQGNHIWKPLDETRLDVKTISQELRGLGGVRAVPQLLQLIEGDMIYASKPLPGSFGLGVLKTLGDSIPLLLDIDDRDLYFRSPGNPLIGHIRNLLNPLDFRASYHIRFMEYLSRIADARTVTTPALQRRFDGTILPQVCDTELFDPDAYDQIAARDNLGLPTDETLVMFPGTPRRHKGVDILDSALTHLDREDIHGVVVGAASSTRSDNHLSGSSRHLSIFGPQPLHEMPRWLAAADIVAVPQKQHPASQYQFPIKLVNAMAMSRPIVTTDLSILPDVVEGCGQIVPPDDPFELARAIAFLADHPDVRTELGEAGRARCVDKYSITAQSPRMRDIIDNVLRTYS